MRALADDKRRTSRAVFLIAALLLKTGSAFGQIVEGAESTKVVSEGDIIDAPEATAETQTSGESDAAPNSGNIVDKTDIQSEISPAEPDTVSDENEIESLKQQMASIKEDYDARLEELEIKGIEDDDISSRDLDKYFRVFGFYDLAFMWRHIGEDTFFKEGDGIVNTSPQFLLQHLNFYFSSQLSRSFSFLTEVQFTFLPNGAMTTDFNSPERQDTTVVDPYTQQEFRWGGIIIPRAYLQWEPVQFFGVKAGYYLTPYGIWHEDHASTVRISIMPPFENDTVAPRAIAGKKPIPSSQLGLQLYGRLFPNDNLRFDYAFTVSNGRGPADTVVDYDDNKGLGLRLKLTYTNSKVEISLGGYGYFGEYTDKYVATWNEELLENYKEYALAADFLLKFYGIRIQAEYLRSLTRYSNGGRPAGWYEFASIPTYSPDTVAAYFYTLAAYQLPLDRWLNGMTLTPYVGVELDLPRDEIVEFKTVVTNFGLNFMPTPFLVLKAEGSRLYTEWLAGTTATVWTVAGQAAVSF